MSVEPMTASTTTGASTESTLPSSSSQPLSPTEISKRAQKKALRQAHRAISHQAHQAELHESRRKREALARMEAVEYCREMLTVDAPPREGLTPIQQRGLMLLQYSGTNYKGIQLQNKSTIPTIEADVLHALYRAGGISRDPDVTLKSLLWQRTARTDTGVHAAFNILSSIILYDEELLQRVSSLLPSAIKIIAILPVCPVPADPTSGGMRIGDACDFHAKNSCTGRVYEYLMPSAVWGLHTNNSNSSSSNNYTLTPIPPTSTTSSSTPLSPTSPVSPASAGLTHLDLLPTRVLHRLLHSTTKAISVLRSPSSPGFLRPRDPDELMPGMHELRADALKRLQQDLPLIFQHLGRIRKKLFKLTRQAHEHEAYHEYTESEKELHELLALLEKEVKDLDKHPLPISTPVSPSPISPQATKNHATPHAGTTHSLLTPTHLTRQVVSTSTSASISETATVPSSSSNSSPTPATPSSTSPITLYQPLSSPAIVLSTFLHDLETSFSAPESSTVFFDPASFLTTRMTSDQVDQVNRVLHHFVGDDKEYKNFTKRLEARERSYFKAKKGTERYQSPTATSPQTTNQTSSSTTTTVAEPSNLDEPLNTAEYPPDANEEEDGTEVVEREIDPDRRYSKRSVTACKIMELSIKNDVEYCRILITGQSFMLNQIRKMLALAVMCTRGMTDESIFQTVFDPAFDYELPLVPARGLLLCGATFHRYERMCIASGHPERYSIQQAIERYKPEIDGFKLNILEPEICDLSTSHRDYRMWLNAAVYEPPKLIQEDGLKTPSASLAANMSPPAVAILQTLEPINAALTTAAMASNSSPPAATPIQ